MKEEKKVIPVMLADERGRQRLDIVCYLFAIFLVGCLIGWIYEEIFYWISEGMLRNRGILYGPWLPIYGIGALGIYGMKPFKKNPVVLFLLCTAITGIVEYVIGWVGIYCLHLRLWDYRGLFGSIQGIVCFRSVISFAILGLVFHYLIEPFTQKLMKKLDRKLVYAVSLVLACFFVADCIMSALFRTPITY